MKYVVIDIGCLECEAPTELLAVVNTVAEVHALGARVRDEIPDADWHGDSLLVAFVVDP